MTGTPEMLGVWPTMANERLVLKVLTALPLSRLMDEGELKNHRLRD